MKLITLAVRPPEAVLAVRKKIVLIRFVKPLSSLSKTFDMFLHWERTECHKAFKTCLENFEDVPTGGYYQQVLKFENDAAYFGKEGLFVVRIILEATDFERI